MKIKIYEPGTHILLTSIDLQHSNYYNILPINGYDIEVLPNGAIDNFFNTCSIVILKYTNNIKVEVNEEKPNTFGEPTKTK